MIIHWFTLINQRNYYDLKYESRWRRRKLSNRRSQAWRPEWRLRRRWLIPWKSISTPSNQYWLPHSGLPKVVAIIIKTIIGAHIVLIPYVASQLGWALFIVVLIALIAIHHFTSILLLKCKNWCRHSNFYTIMHWIWPCAGSKIFCTLLLALNNMAFCTYDET